MAQQGYTVPIADPEIMRRKSAPDAANPEDLSQADQDLIKESNDVLAARTRYGDDRKSKEYEWTESYKMYQSWMDSVLNPFLSDLFIPKTHEAVEQLAAFLIGSNQSISASPEQGGDTQKAEIAGKWLEFLWRKQLKMRLKILVWIKQGIVFGNGIMKVGWDAEKKIAWASVCAIEDVYFDYYEPELQDSEYVMHEFTRLPDEVKEDEKYDLKEGEVSIRGLAITGGTTASFDSTALFATYDGSFKKTSCEGKVLVLEVWCVRDNKLKTFIPTSQGWRKVRDADNPNHYNDKDKTPFTPFIKLRFKPSPVPDRAYDIGAVYPTVKIQKAFNGLINEYFDNVVLVNNKMWIKRRGARINPADLVRRPGGIITVSNISTDLKSDEVGDVKQSIIEMLNRLDQEFQKASMITSLLQSFSNTATGDSLEQVPLQTMRDMLDQNVVEALSEAGQMILAITTNNAEGNAQIVLYETDNEVGTLDFDPSKLDGMTDVKITPERNPATGKDVLSRDMVDLLKIVGPDQMLNAKYPEMKKKIIERWLESKGVGDTDVFFQEAAMAPPANPAVPALGAPPVAPPMAPPPPVVA